MTSLRSLGVSGLILALLLFSLASAAPSPTFVSGQISAQAYTAVDWSGWATTAWKYYTPDVGVNSASGLHRATLAWTCFTDWDLGSYMYAIIYARKLNLISDTGTWQFQDRIDKVLNFLQNRPLGANNSPYLAYRWDYQSPYYCSDTGTAASNPWDSGRLLAGLYALKVFRSTYSTQVDGIVDRSKSIIDVWARKINSGGASYYNYLAAEGFAAFGYDESTAFNNIDNYADSRGYLSVYGQNLPKLSNTLTEPLIHVILEGDSLWHAPTAKFLDFANRVYLAQSGRYSALGKLTAWSEGGYQNPFYIYEYIIPRDVSKTWVIGNPEGVTYDVTPVAYAKVAFAYFAIYGENAYTLALINAAKNLASSSQGFGEAVHEDYPYASAIDIWSANTLGFYSDKTNEFVLAAASRALSSQQTTESTTSSQTVQTTRTSPVTLTTTSSTFTTPSTTTAPSIWRVPGFPFESILAGVFGGLIALTVMRRRRRR